eukprot:3928901-Amphidinium_carterae.1
MTISKVQTTHNPADVLTRHLPSATISSHLERLCLQTDNETQAVNNLRGLYFEESSNASFPSSPIETQETSNADTTAQCTA